MAQPSTRQELIDYCLRQLGAPVLEINVAEEQVQDLVDDAIQFFQERHFDGVHQTYLKYRITQDDVDRGLARPPGAPTSDAGQTGIASTVATTNIGGASTSFTYYENSNFLQVNPDIIGVNKVFQFDGSYSGSGMFNIKYQYMLNDVFGMWGGYGASGMDLTSYDMTMSYLETMNFLLNTHKQIRFNQRKDRMYLDIDWTTLKKDDYLVIDCWRAMDPNDYSRVWNDSFLKPYLTALIKKQWGQNLIKFQGVKLPGGIEFNGRAIFDDGQRELDEIRQKMLSTYELPPLDMIG